MIYSRPLTAPNWENISFDNKRKVVDGLISQIRATSDYVQIEWKI